MRTECSRNCWIAGGVAGLLVWLSIGLVGSAGWMAGLAMGLLTAWMLGGTLVWGLCQGAGNRADNEALLEGGWSDEPFNPSRRVVRAGGDVVSQEPLALAGRIPGGAPLDSRTVTPREGDSPRPRIVAGAGPDAPVRTQARQTGDKPAASADGVAPPPVPGDAPVDDAEVGTDDPALLQAAPGATPQVAHRTTAAVEGMDPEKPEVRASRSEAVALEASGFVEPRADSEAGADPRAPEGGIEPLATRDDAEAEERGGETGERGKAKDKSGKSKSGKNKDKKKNGKAGAGDGGFAGGEPRVMTLTGDDDDDAATGADDLTRIRGIGPMLQTWLGGYGVTRVEQIAAWDDADIARYAGMMGRMGHRIREEDWVGQARLLAAGGETAHSHAADTGEAG